MEKRAEEFCHLHRDNVVSTVRNFSFIGCCVVLVPRTVVSFSTFAVVFSTSLNSGSEAGQPMQSTSHMKLHRIIHAEEFVVTWAN